MWAALIPFGYTMAGCALGFAYGIWRTWQPAKKVKDPVDALIGVFGLFVDVSVVLGCTLIGTLGGALIGAIANAQ